MEAPFQESFLNLRATLFLVGSLPYSLTLHFIAKLGPALRGSQTVTHIPPVRKIQNHDREPFDRRSGSIGHLKAALELNANF